MKKLVSITLLAFIFLSINAYSQPTTANKSNSTSPEIKFDKTTHNFGAISKGASGECEFTFKNVGKEPLVLSNVVSTCGCTVPSWTKEPILPGKGGSIKVIYNTNNVGTISKSVTVISNASNDRVVLSLQGNVLAAPTENAPEKPKTDLHN